MDWKELLALIREKSKKKLLVFGPPRSGTTLTSCVLHEETDFRFIPEDVALKMKPETRNELFRSDESFVFHANNALRYFPTYLPLADVLSIVVRRDKDLVLASAAKCGKLGSFNYYYRFCGKKKNYYDNYWNRMNRWLLDNPNNEDLVVFEYDQLQSHPMWIAKENRKHFGIKQVRHRRNQPPPRPYIQSPAPKTPEKPSVKARITKPKPRPAGRPKAKPKRNRVKTPQSKRRWYPR